MNPTRIRFCLLGGLVSLPLAVLLILGAGQLLGALGDQDGHLWFLRLAILGGVAWLLDLVGLVALLASASLGCCREKSDPP